MLVVQSSASGLREVKRNDGLEGLSVAASLRLYGLDGAVLDATRYLRVGSFSIPSNQIAILVDPELGRLFALIRNQNVQIRAYDLNTFQHLGTIKLNPEYPYVEDFYYSLVRWADDGLAFLRGNKLHLIRSPPFAP